MEHHLVWLWGQGLLETSTNYKKEAKPWVYSLQYVTFTVESGVYCRFFRPFFWDQLWLPLLAVQPIFNYFFYCSYLLHVGIAVYYYSWRFMQLLLGLVGFLVFFLILFFLPETYHPNKRGVDNLDPNLLSKWRPVILNPLQPLWLLRSPNLLIVVRILFPFRHLNV